MRRKDISERMKQIREAYEAVADMFSAEGFSAAEAVREIARFRAADQILASRPGVQSWGITLEQLYALTVETTEAAFGPVGYDTETFRKLYGPSFRIELADFAELSGVYPAVRSGAEYKGELDELLIRLREKESGVFLFAYVENYAGIVDALLQGFAGMRIVLHTSDEPCFGLLTSLYPLADIRKDLSAFAEETEGPIHTVCIAAECDAYDAAYADAIRRDIFESGIWERTHEGRFYFPTMAAYAGDEFLSSVFSHRGLTAVTESLDCGFCICEIGEGSFETIALATEESIDGHRVRTELGDVSTSILKEKAVLPVAYAYEAAGIEMRVGKAGAVSFGAVVRLRYGTDEGETIGDMRVLSLYRERGAYRIGFGEEEGGVAFECASKEDAYICYLYFGGSEGAAILGAAALHARTEEGLARMLLDCGYPLLTDETRSMICEEAESERVAYETAVSEAECRWKKAKDRLANICYNERRK